MKKLQGFTLIESIVVMVVMAFAMVTITRFLMPQVASSADPHYQSRAAALGQSVMTSILARGFDEKSDSVGGAMRCSSVDSGATACMPASGLGPDGSETPQQFNDVDDFIGCWTPNGASSCNDLYDLISAGENSGYHNFRLDIAVAYSTSTSAQMVKKITLTVHASDQTPIEYVAYRGNY
ncbi:prepilin-type N-terminal cleavage/methylation domain-containing protein [Vibrio kasasachensis]|uniref:type IV pilus modification PilV family protein n=1 Tax=Vibrio kasasachensis TaxID=2910248 RepID=UPI003D141F9C